jgi:hypothetical protein
MTVYHPNMKILWTCFLTLTAPTLALADKAMFACDIAQRLEPNVAAAIGTAPAETCPEIGFALPADVGVARSQAGAYYPGSGRIDLAPDLDLTSILGQSYLLHELVHAAQYRAGKDKSAPCPAALEAQAYGLQADFLQAHGLGRDAMLIRILASQLGTCGAGDLTY